MFELFLIACVGLRACEYIAAPFAYVSEPVCARQAALIAGMVRGRHADAGRDLAVEFTCRQAAEPGLRTATLPDPPGGWPAR